MIASTSKCIVIDIGRNIVKSTDKAICLTVGTKQEWFPKEGLQYSLEKGKLACPIWIAKKKGLLQDQANQLTPRQTFQHVQTNTPKQETPKLDILEEFAKLTNEVKQINQRLIAIQRELNKGVV